MPRFLRSLVATRHSIGVRLLIGVLLFSGSITLVLSATQLYIDYRRDVSVIESRLNEISRSYLDSLAEGLWTLDEKQLRLQLEGILRLPDIRAVEVREAGTDKPPTIKLNRGSDTLDFARDYPLHHRVEGRDIVIGTLRVEATLANVYRRLANTASTILVSQAATIFLASLFIVYLFHHLVTRHLSAIAAYVDSYRISDSPLQLRLRRRPPRHQDELQRVVTAFNTLSHNLHIAYRDLAEREAKVRRLVDANIIGVFTWQLVGRDDAGDAIFREVNDAFLRIVGYDREDLVTGSVGQRILTPPDWQDRTQRAMAEMKLNGTFQPYEKEYIRKDGSRVPVLIGAARFDETAEQGVAFVLDLTEQKQAEAALRESEEQWKAVFESNPVMYFLVDETGTILSVNPFGAEQLGYTANELIGRPVQILFHEADRECALRNKASCLEHPGQTLSWELRKLRKNGEALWVRETARAMLIKNRPVVLAVSEDITERRRATEALAQVQAELAHANRVATMGQLTASIAHEVSQPVGGAAASGQAALRWLAGGTPDLDAARRAIERVIRDTSRAGEVIDRVRAVIRKAPPRKDRFAINEAIREVVSLTGGEAARNDVTVQMQLADGLPQVEGDRVQLQQVILNLVVNAIEAMGGVSWGPRDLRVKTARSDGDMVLVAVEDSGPGLPPDNLEHVFEAFYTTKPSGLGMGLSICRSIIEAHGGRLWATANEPCGAIFQFTMPARDDTR